MHFDITNGARGHVWSASASKRGVVINGKSVIYDDFNDLEPWQTSCGATDPDFGSPRTVTLHAGYERSSLASMEETTSMQP
jgi:hypothetical protein